MKALHSVELAPLSVLSRRSEPIRKFSLSTISPFKNQEDFSSICNSEVISSVSRSLKTGLVLLSSILSSETAKALTYEEALEQSVTSSISTSDIDVDGVFNFISYATENPIVVGGAVAVFTVPLIVSQLLSMPKAWGVVGAKDAYAKLGDDATAQLLDIRELAEIKQAGSPDIRGLKKKAVAVVYKGEDKLGFLNKLSLKFKDPGSTTLFVLDKFDGNSELVAELVTANGFKAAYAIKDGTEGSRGWKTSGLPWALPKKGLSLEFGNLTDAIAGAFGEASDSVPFALGVAAAAGLGILAFTEVETLLQILGSAALVQFVSKKLLFAEDRKQTIKQFEVLLNEKVAPKQLVGDMQQIGKALLPSPLASRALPAPAEANSTPINSAVEKSEPTTEASVVSPKVEAASEPTPLANSVPKAEVQEGSIPGFQRPLSPYPKYPDYKPPSSPVPSPP